MNVARSTIWNARRVSPADVRQAFDQFFQVGESPHAQTAGGQWSPRVDIREEASRFVIAVDVPGVDPASIDVSMEKNVLTIKGERSVLGTEQGGTFNRQERLHGAFQRSFALPDSADADGISANGQHGVLEIFIPKKAETSPRRITINAGH